jgi:hypothetical protein
MAKLNTTRFFNIYHRWCEQDCDLSSPLVQKMWNVFVEDNPTSTEWLDEELTLASFEDLIEIAEQGVA